MKGKENKTGTDSHGFRPLGHSLSVSSASPAPPCETFSPSPQWRMQTGTVWLAGKSRNGKSLLEKPVPSQEGISLCSGAEFARGRGHDGR